MANEIVAAVHSARLLMDMVKANETLANFHELVSAISEVNAQLMSAQTAALLSQETQATLTERIGELEKEIAELKDWKREADRYQLGEIAPGVPVRVLKPGREQGEAEHSLCATCFDDHKKSFLQHGPAVQQVSCARCGGKWSPPEVRRAIISVTNVK
jgi:hypothetical protein